MDLDHHQGTAAPGLAAPDAALNVKSQHGANELGFMGQETTNSPNCGAAAAAAREADEFIATLFGAASPATVKRAIVFAACNGEMTPTAATWMLRLLGLVHE